MTRRSITWLGIVVFWTVFALLCAFQTWLAMILHGHSLPRMIGHQIAVWYVWVLMTPAVFSLARRAPIFPLRTRNVLLHVLMMLVTSTLHTFAWIELTILIRPFDVMTSPEFGANFRVAVFARLPLEILIYAAILGVAHARDTSDRASQLERSLADARLHALELQIQPHFLFNTLNAISSLVRGRQNDEAIEVIAGLSDLLRYTLDHAGVQRVPLEQEAAILRRYLDIQQVRFSDRLQVTIDVAKDAERAAVPTLILQPLAENALRHGVAQTAGAARIDVKAFREDGQLRIEMFNSGTLHEDAPRGIGLRNTAERLAQLYPTAHKFELRNAFGGVLATIAIPWSELR